MSLARNGAVSLQVWECKMFEARTHPNADRVSKLHSKHPLSHNIVTLLFSDIQPSAQNSLRLYAA